MPPTPASAATRILIKGGTVVNAIHKEVSDVYVEDGLIVSVRPDIKARKNWAISSLNLLISTFYCC